jgi:glucokinase
MLKKQFVIGVDIGGTNIRVALVDEKGNIIRKIKESSGEDTVEKLINSIDTLSEVKIDAIGIGLAGVIDKEERVVKKSPNLPAIENKRFIKDIEERFSVPVVVENDANAAALGEKWLGAGRESENFVMLTLGTGIGGGVIYRGDLLNVAAELGHITVEAEGLSCPCGNNGCLESYASARALVSYVVEALEKGKESIMREAYQGNFYRITSEDIYRYALEGDSLARDSLRRAGKYLGIGIATLVNIFSPEAVIVGGGLIGAWDILAKEAKKEAERRAFPQLIEKTHILPATLGEDAGLLGAAYLALKFNETEI